MHMGYHVEQHHCSIGWLGHRLIHVHSMELVVVVECVGLVVVVECMCYVEWLGLDVVLELVHELGSKLLTQCYIPLIERHAKENEINKAHENMNKMLHDEMTTALIILDYFVHGVNVCCITAEQNNHLVHFV